MSVLYSFNLIYVHFLTYTACNIRTQFMNNRMYSVKSIKIYLLSPYRQFGLFACNKWNDVKWYSIIKINIGRHNPR